MRRAHISALGVLHLNPVTSLLFSLFFFFNDTATTEIYTLSLHDALPISGDVVKQGALLAALDDRDLRLERLKWTSQRRSRSSDRKSTRLNSSHTVISYAVFCLKKKKKKNIRNIQEEITRYE